MKTPFDPAKCKGLAVYLDPADGQELEIRARAGGYVIAHLGLCQLGSLSLCLRSGQLRRKEERGSPPYFIPGYIAVGEDSETRPIALRDLRSMLGYDICVRAVWR